MRTKMVVYRDGVRYWATKGRRPDGRTTFRFWSSADWPFHHASYTPDRVDRADVLEKFREFIPKSEEG